MANKPNRVGAWINNISKFERDADLTQIAAHPLNARTHPQQQVTAVESSMTEIGVIDALRVNVNSGRLVDGHLRIDRWLQSGAKTGPVLWLDLTEEQERIALAVFDPIAGMAVYDKDLAEQLFGGVQELIEAPGLSSLLDSLLEAIPRSVDVSGHTRELTDSIPSDVAANTNPGDVWCMSSPSGGGYHIG